MKVVLFCGGAGMRLRGYSEDVPKPMVTIGCAPGAVARHEVLRALRSQGFHSLSRATKPTSIKDYFLEYEESVSNDFVFSQGGGNSSFMQRDIDDWKITFVDTGQDAPSPTGFDLSSHI